MRNKKRTAPAMEIPDNVTEQEFKVILDKWMTDGGYQQVEINADNVATEYSQYRKDLPMYVIEQWYKMPWEKQLKICRESGTPEKWITRVMNLSIKSNSSPFHSLYRKFSIKSREQFDSTTNPIGIDFASLSFLPDFLLLDQSCPGIALPRSSLGLALS